MGHRSKSSVRCQRCRLQTENCMCEHIPRLPTKTKLILVMHRREILTTTATGPLALSALPHSELLLHGVKDQALDLSHLHGEGRRVLLLYPSESARQLTSQLLAEDPRPVTLIVPDGSWRQASRAARRIPGTERAERVILTPDAPTEWGLRRETKLGGLATLEAIARALGVLEGQEIRTALETLFRESLRRQRAVRPFAPNLAPQAGSLVQTRTHMHADPPPASLEILYQDDWLVCVNKPSGTLVHRGWGEDGPLALQLLRDQLGRLVFPVHRLDRQTSGALLFAFYPEVARDLQAGFESGSISKTYLALCRGHDPSLTVVDHPLQREPGQGVPKPARTDLSLLGHAGRYGLYRVWPRTGRAHQIRRHLKHASHPLVGDVRYGKGAHNRIFREEHDFHRLALHCEQLELLHPRTGGLLRINADLPPDFSRLLAKLGLHPRAPVCEKSDAVAAIPEP